MSADVASKPKINYLLACTSKQSWVYTVIDYSIPDISCNGYELRTVGRYLDRY
jgi:hypothetical protein